ncbi:MAG: CDP-alcohol phosphatidyltransferase family protein, partial [Parvibaculaceae bacterium]
MNIQAAKAAGSGTAPVLCVIGSCDLRLWALTPAQRFKRQLGNVAEISLDAAHSHIGPILFVRADAVIDQPLIPILMTRRDLLLIGDGDVPLAVQTTGDQADTVSQLFAGGKSADVPFDARRPSALDAQFWKALRKRETPYAFQLSSANQGVVEWRMFMGTYKGATDLVTKHLWPRPAFIATRILAPLGVTPNIVTLLGAVLVFAAFWLFWQGQYGWGLAAAWLMTFLDTVDGKLARTTLTSSKWGDV